MIEEAGGRRHLEEQLEQWALEEQMKRTAAQSVGSHNPKWQSADELALSIMRDL